MTAGSLVFMPRLGPRARQQFKGVVLILLLCGQEAVAFGTSVSAASLPPENARPEASQEDASHQSSVSSEAFRRSTPSLAANATAGCLNRSCPRRTDARQSRVPDPSKVVFLSDVSAPRRLTAVDVAYEVIAFGTGNIQNEPRSTQGVTVRAGIAYRTFTIHAASGLGEISAEIRVKLAPFDLRATMKNCAEVDERMKRPPFDGTAGQEFGQAETSRNDFETDGGIIFPQAGLFRLCYAGNGQNWEELAPPIRVLGAERTDYKFWCTVKTDPVKRERCDNYASTTVGCECQGKVEGFNVDESSIAVPKPWIGLGLPQPANPAWKLTLTDMATGSEKCGTRMVSPFRAPSPANNGISTVTNFEGYEVHNLGTAAAGTRLGVWQICYCVGYDANLGHTNGVLTPCYKNDVKDFMQPIGELVTVQYQTKSGTNVINVYPTLRFSLELMCGTDRTGGQAYQGGGCTAGDQARYKIVFQKPENDLPYFAAGAGCRFLEQAKTHIANTAIMGGHLGPNNCEAAAKCNQQPAVNDGRFPTWYDVQLDATYLNSVMIGKNYDVCYCDKNCLNSMNWFKAGEITVNPVEAFFSLDQSAVTKEEPVVNTMYYVIIRGRKVPANDPQDLRSGEFDGSWETTGTKTREMKILRDMDGSIDKVACLSSPQPDVVSGHRLESGNTDYTAPDKTLLTAAGRPFGQMYGVARALGQSQAEPNIKILEAGWFAICYCDSNCNEMPNWSVFGRVLIAGPNQGQQWTRYRDVTFAMDVVGWGLKVTNRLRILSSSDELADCGTVDQTDYVYSDDNTAAIKDRTTTQALVIEMKHDPRGTEISFSKSHGLKDGDYIRLKNVNAGTVATDEMYNRVHQVFVSCDRDATPTSPQCYKILIPVRFQAADFPANLKWDTVDWMRNSVEEFTGIRITVASPEGRGYKVCWAEDSQNKEDFIGQAGQITVKEPLVMEEVGLGLTTVMPNIPSGGAPVVIYFETGAIARYEQATGPMQLKIVFMSEQRVTGTGNYIQALYPKDYNLNDLSVDPDYNTLDKANQAVCGKFFSEMWSNAPDGFPMPMGCYYTEDTVNRAQKLQEIRVVFSPRNHLRKETKYMLVMNAQVKPELDEDFPSNGAVHIWSMDDAYTNPYDVVELGKAYPRPSKRVPPRDPQGNLELNRSPDPQFHMSDGFKILPADGSTEPHIIKMTRYCISHDPIKADITPHPDNQCKPCESEQDCGNWDAVTETSNPNLNWCMSPISASCPGIRGQLTNMPAFTFSLRATPGRPIKPSTILRIFLFPLTQWDMTTRCEVKMVTCRGPEGGACNDPVASSESIIGGATLTVEDKFQVNIIKVTLPSIMADITSSVMHTIAIGSLPLPQGGFTPKVIAAELMKNGEKAPDYWGGKVAQGGARLSYTPRIVSASIISFLGDGNHHPFKGQERNILYIRFVIGATFFARNGGDVTMEFRPPPAAGSYLCDCPPNGLDIPPLGVLKDKFPSTNGRLGGSLPFGVRNPNTPGNERLSETVWTKEVTPIVACKLTFRQQMIYYANTVIYTAVRVHNPTYALKRDSPLNYWNLVVRDVANNIQAPIFKLKGQAEGYAGSVSVLGKLSHEIITPKNFGVGNKNTMVIVFKTEQEVGTVRNPVTELWVDAPPGFDFGRYCAASQLPGNYYIPEPAEDTQKLPVGPYIVCTGAPTNANQVKYNRAKIRTTGRLLASTLYGFQLEVTNVASYVRSQLDKWKIWTYMDSGAGVDGSFITARFNENTTAGANMSWGVYQHQMPPENLQISIADLRPTVGNMAPTEITFLPIIVQVPMQKAVRILAPSGYVWDFLQNEFRYKARAQGVPESQIVPGAQNDLPISGVPAKPISAPLNQLTIDYMQSTWIPGIKYGFIAKIRVPLLAPTASANQFSIEFGYSESENSGRLEAGVVPAPLVKRVIGGGIGYTTSIVGERAEITFSMRTVTHIPRAGGIVIVGPPNFKFDDKCQPKPAIGFPELPYDSTCLHKTIQATGEPEISIVAGVGGIPPKDYQFSLVGDNPREQVYLVSAGRWTFYTYEVVSKKTSLDYNTSVAGYAVNAPMRDARLEAPPWTSCTFMTQLEQELFPNRPITDCPYDEWQFWPPRGFRNDRPGVQSALIISFRLSGNSFSGSDLIVRAPEGYVFNTECRVVVNSAQVFNDEAAPTDDPPFSSADFEEWDYQQVIAASCAGVDNIAKIRINCGGICLQQMKRYVFRIHILQMPMFTPRRNEFILEYFGMASQPFKGIEVWAVNNLSMVPTTTASSLRGNPTYNEILITMRTTNDLPNGGHLRIEAPAGFQIPLNCKAELRVAPDEQPNMTAIEGIEEQVNTREWAEWNGGNGVDYKCEGDVTESSFARVRFEMGRKYLKAGVTYFLLLTVINPQVTTQYAEPWTYKTFKDASPNDILDSASVEGFPINDAAPHFAWKTPDTVNALAKQLLEFNMSFPQNVLIGDKITVIAPIKFFFSDQGDSRCPEYLYLDGSLRRTIPECGANSISWLLAEETVPQRTAIRFMVQVQNPPETPIDNFFQVRHTSPDGTRKASRMIPGFAIIPELKDPQVVMEPPVNPCRSSVKVVTQQNCQAAGSSSRIKVIFMPTNDATIVQVRGKVGNAIFDFSTASFTTNARPGPPDPATMVTLIERTSNMITAERRVVKGTEVSLQISDVRNPSVPGRAMFSITTFNNEATISNRVDEKLNLPAFSILQYIELVSSRVSPIYYNAKGATISFELQPLAPINANNVLLITRPPGYTLIEGSLQTFRELRSDEHGLDFMRVWSEDFENPEDYFCVVSRDVLANTRILFTIEADLPGIPYAVANWFFRTYIVEPLYDTDGEVLDSNPVPYPWINRGLTPTATNDGAFTGFLLVGQIPFTVTPSLQTPGAEIRLTVNFELAAGVEAEDVIRLDVNGPVGYIFADSCLFTGSSSFSKCTGYRHTASLVTVLPRLKGTDITVHLSVTNPGATPTSNKWNLALYKDTDTSYVNWSLGQGYEILACPVTFRGNNQLAVSSTGFFTFAPVRDSDSPILYVVVIPPPNQGFRLLCTGVEKLGFSGTPQCISGAVNEPLTLRFGNGTLVKEEEYTFGVGILNPGGRPDTTLNYWGVLLKDYAKQTFDGNLRIPGLDLKTMPIRGGVMGWLTAVPRVQNTVSMQMRVLHNILAGMITKVEIGAPEGVMHIEGASVLMAPITLPTLAAKPSTVRGPILTINLDQTKDVAPGMYNIRIEVSNPGSTPWDNTWSLIVYKDIEVEFSNYQVGYNEDQESPYSLTGGTDRKSVV